MKIGSKRRRTKQEIEDDKLAVISKQIAIEEKLALIENLQRENAKLKSQQPSNDEATEILT